MAADGSSARYDDGGPVDYEELYANTWTEEDQRAFAAEPTSSKRFLIAWALALFLGPIGAQRYYLGLIPTAVTKTLLFAGAVVCFGLDQINIALALMGVVGTWTIIDLFLLLSGSMRDRQDHRLDGYRRLAGPCAAVTVLVLVGMVMVAMVVGTSAAVGG